MVKLESEVGPRKTRTSCKLKLRFHVTCRLCSQPPIACCSLGALHPEKATSKLTFAIGFAYAHEARRRPPPSRLQGEFSIPMPLWCMLSCRWRGLLENMEDPRRQERMD